MTILEAMTAAGAFSGSTQWPGLQMQLLASALTSSNGGIGIDQFRQAYVYAGSPEGNVYVANEENALCFDSVNEIVWQKTDGLISNTGWELPYGGEGGGGFQIINGDPPDIAGNFYGLFVDATGSDATGGSGSDIRWTYPTTQLMEPGPTPSKIYLQRSPTLTNHPLGGTHWFELLITPPNTGAPSDGDWQTMQTWIQAATGWDDPTLPSTYHDNSTPNRIYNYRLVMFVGGGPGGTYAEVDWDIASAIKHYVLVGASCPPPNTNQICLSWT